MQEYENARAAYNDILNKSVNSHETLSNIIKVADLADSKKVILEVMSSVSAMSNNKENPAFRFLRKFGFSKAIDKISESSADTMNEGKSVAEVSSGLLSTITTKRASVIKMVDELYNLKESMVTSYKDMEVIVAGIDEFINDCTERELFHFMNLKAEILESMSYNEDNIISANGTIKGAEMATAQINEMIPKLRSQVNDSMVIRGSLNELEMLTEMCSSIDEMCSTLRSENREGMEKALIGILDKSVLSDERLKSIETNVMRQTQIQGNIKSKIIEITTQRAKAVDKLQIAVSRNKSNLELDDKSGYSSVRKESQPNASTYEFPKEV